MPPVGFVDPMLPTLVDEAPRGGEWIHEIKFDGYRTVLTIRGKDVHAYTRNGFDWIGRYAPVIAAARGLRCRSAILDGEMCVQNASGITDFPALRGAIKSAPERLVLFAFDLIALDGRDLRGEALRERRRRLRDLVGGDAASRVQLSHEHVGDGPAFFRAADQHGLEGIVSKRADSLYTSGRTKAWVKVKSYTVADYAVLGVERSRTGLPVALLARLGRSPAYVGDAVVTLKARERERFWATVEELGAPRARLAGTIAKRKAAWMREGMVARVRHLRGEDKLRHASIQAIGAEGELPGDVDDARHPDDA
ncbi:RNA ligase family protein [Lichenihabitans sp. Uapishka_5]|uniref:ATP-dependent DNA ligase n=1 Tax=Lichenihabitans sp. Uapishka_5 TaxID=3037302 RepID=UPI0029E81FBA|nr:RNA ligase family protein [Lichenihabitans sp. Uapishka_5]MDX7951337.1 RNA ligase family protein [Lichenihabitans sp. Uapishka_5]